MRSAVIDSGENLSRALDVGDGKFHGISIPAGWAAGATTITFQVSHDGVTWQNLYNDTGTEVSATAAASRNVSLSSIALDLAPWRFIKVRSGTSASAVTQEGNSAAKRIFDFGSSKTLTVTSGVKGVASNEIIVEFKNAADDNLAVSKVDSLKKIIIALANTTGSKNADTAIEAAVQALSTVGGIDVSAMTVAGSTEYYAAPVARTAAATTFTVGEKTLTFTSGVVGPAGNVISVTLETAAGDTLAVSNPEDTYDIVVQLASTTDSKNTAAAIQALVQGLSAIGPTGETLDVSGMTVAGNEAYDAAPLAGVKASSTVALIDDTDTSMGALTATAGLAGPHGDVVLSGLLSSFEANTEDILSVTATENAEGYPIAFIKLANETASNNSAAAILTALKALVPTGTDYDGYISAMTLTADATWTASPPITTPALLDFTTTLPTNGEDPIPAPVTQDLEGGAEAIEPVTASLAGGADIELVLAIKD